MFYLPNIPYAIYLAIKAKHATFFSAVNPAIKSSGNGTESKYETIQLVPTKHKPKSVLATPKTSFQTVLQQLQKENIRFPLIAKPDVGFRGLLVQKIHTKEALQTYLKNYNINIILQEFLEHKNECGVFYHRNPNEKNGIITSLTLKKFAEVTGNGIDTLEQLIQQDERANLYYNLFKEIHHTTFHTVPKKNKTIKLSEIGNHSKGTQFLNGNQLISKELTKTFDQLSNHINGWYYGRVDIKYNDFKNLENGSDYKILEINGIIAEPTHIYDSANYTYFKALKTIRKHWQSLYQIATINNKQHNIPYKTTKLFINELVALNNYLKTLKNM